MVLVALLQAVVGGDAMAYPYYWPYAPYPDPLALMYSWMYMWTYTLTTIYYLEMFKTTIDIWRKFMETAFKTPIATSTT